MPNIFETCFSLFELLQIEEKDEWIAPNIPSCILNPGWNKYVGTSKYWTWQLLLIEFLLFCDSWQDKEHPEVDAKEQDDLEDDLAHDGLSEVEGAVHHHSPKLDQDHDQERSRHLILWQRWRDVCRWVFLEGTRANVNVVAADFGCGLRWKESF